VFGVRSEIADGGETQSRDDGIGYRVNVFVNPAGLETAVQADVAVAGNHFAVHQVGELPLRARNERSLGITGVPDRQHIARIFGIGDGILTATYAPVDEVSQRDLVGVLGEHEVPAQ
jgi:hypothetical protein